MTKEEFENLKRGDIVRHKGGTHSFVVDHHCGDHVNIVRALEMTNPDEWDIIEKNRPKLIKI